MRLPRSIPLSLPSSLLCLFLFSTFIAAQNLPALTDTAGNEAQTNNPAAAKTKADTKTTAKAAKTTAEPNAPSSAAKDTKMPAMTTADSGPSGLPTLDGVKAPTPTVPPTAGAPYMQKSNLPEGTVFICVGAILGFIGLVVLAWRGLVAWSLHRSVRKAAMAQSVQYTPLRDPKRKTMSAGTTLYSQTHGSALSFDQLAATSKGGSKTNTARSSLFFSPTAGSGMQTPGNRNSGYLPAGYYAAGNSSAGGGSGMTQIGGSSLRPQSKRYSQAVAPSPPGTPSSLPPSRGAEVAFGRPSTAGLSTNASRSSLNLSAAPEGRAPSAYLEDLFEGHSSGRPVSSHDPLRGGDRRSRYL